MSSNKFASQNEQVKKERRERLRAIRQRIDTASGNRRRLALLVYAAQTLYP